MKKIVLFGLMAIVGLSVILGLNYYLDKKTGKKVESESVLFESVYQTDPGESEKEGYSQVIPDQEESEPETQLEETVIYTHPEEGPEEALLPEQAGEGEGIEINIYFTNMASIDESGILPYNAWENITKELQIFLNLAELEVSEIQAVESSIEKQGDTVTFYAVFPESPGKKLKLDYEIKQRKWTFLIEFEEELKNEIEENSIDTSGFE